MMIGLAMVRAAGKAAFLVTIMCGIVSGRASAQPAEPAHFCPPESGNAEVAAILEQMLKPGSRFSWKDIPPATMTKLAAMQKAGAEHQRKDWPNLCRYAASNAAMTASGRPPEVIFLGDSITEIWRTSDPAFFSSTALGRGISGQTSPQILLRFYPDVVALRPRIVHILAGTNDVAGNTGPVSDATIVDNIRAMIDIAQANRITVILGSIPPSRELGSQNPRPAERIATLNLRLRALAAQRKAIYIDYHTPLSDADGGFRSTFSNDGVHPNRDGYGVMKPLAEAAIAKARKVRRSR